jgi:hypothetical protein
VIERRASHFATDTSAEYPAVFDKTRAFLARLRFRLGLKLDRGCHTARCSAGLSFAESRYTKTGLEWRGMNQSNGIAAIIFRSTGEVMLGGYQFGASFGGRCHLREDASLALRLALLSRATLKLGRVGE